MKNRNLLNILSVFLILTLLPATSGVSIFHHICNKEGTHSISIYAEMKCNKHEEETNVCEHCLKNSKSCPLVKESNCIEYVEFLAIDTDFISASKLVLQPVDFELPLIGHFTSALTKSKEKNNSEHCIKQVFQKPVQYEISFIKFQSQNKSSEKSTDYFIS